MTLNTLQWSLFLVLHTLSSLIPTLFWLFLWLYTSTSYNHHVGACSLLLWWHSSFYLDVLRWIWGQKARGAQSTDPLTLALLRNLWAGDRWFSFWNSAEQWHKILRQQQSYFIKQHVNSNSSSPPTPLYNLESGLLLLLSIIVSSLSASSYTLLDNNIILMSSISELLLFNQPRLCQLILWNIVIIMAASW